MDENTKSYADLAEEVNKEFSEELLNSEKIKNKLKKLMDKDANFKDVYEVSNEVSDKMKIAFKEKISKDILPDGKMQKDIADSVIKANLKEGHEVISGYAADTQGLINKKQGINIKGIQAEFNEERCDNLINKLCRYDDYDKGKWLLDELIKNFCNSAVDDTIEANADFLSKSGFKETITRSTNGGCCEWCDEVSGVYDYEYVKEWVLKEPKHNVFSRHRYCNCIISHNTEKGRKAVNNQWNEDRHKKKKRIELSEEDKKVRIPAFASSVEITQKVKRGEISLKVNKEHYEKHFRGSKQFNAYYNSRLKKGLNKQSILTIDMEEAQALINKHSGKGVVTYTKKMKPRLEEEVNFNKIIGYYVQNGKEYPTTKGRIYYSKNGAHIVPIRGDNFD